MGTSLGPKHILYNYMNLLGFVVVQGFLGRFRVYGLGIMV